MSEQLDYAMRINLKVYLHLVDGGVVSGWAEISNDQDRVKLRNSEGVMWIPNEDIISFFTILKSNT